MKKQSSSRSFSRPALRILPLGGAGVNKNLFVYEYGDDIVIVDCGIAFPEAEQLGVDLVIPDIRYLRPKLKNIRGIVITHGHEDHYGALPYLLEDLGNPPIYSSNLVYGLIQVKLKDFGLLKQARLFRFQSHDYLKLGCFTFTPFRVNHSIPDSFAFFIETPVGNIVHAADFKFDWTPVDGKLFEVSKAARLAEKGVLCLLSDCLGANRQGYTHSERIIQETFEKEVSKARGQVFITTISSNISRIQQAVNTAVKFGRKVSFIGMSLQKNVEVARNMGYLKIPPRSVVPPEKIRQQNPGSLLIVIAGSYGQINSSLYRLALNNHRWVKLEKEDLVIFSADPIPGYYDQVGVVIDRLTAQGARVVYSEMQEDLHVSGHGSQGDLALLAALIKPRYFLPIGGTPRHIRAYANLIQEMGIDSSRVLELSSGEGILLQKNKVMKEKMTDLTDVFVDGSRIGDVGRVVLNDRRILAAEGIFVVIVQAGEEGKFRDNVNVISRGFVYMADADQLVQEAKKIVRQEIKDEPVKNWSQLRSRVENRLSEFLYRQTQRRPMVLAVLV